MSIDRTNPNMRQARALFKKGDSQRADVKTQPMGGPPNSNGEVEQEAPTMPMPGAQGLTQPALPFKRRDPDPGSSRFKAVQPKDLGPVVGWLVILEGPGQGRSMELGYGSNSIGRGYDNEVRLPFGDMGISDEQHAFIAYDAVTRKAYLSNNNSSRNLVYLNGMPLFGTVELPDHGIVGLGSTKLQYIPFCTEAFDWKALLESTEK